MSHRNLLGLPANPGDLPTSLETELGANCADPRRGSRFGRMAEQSFALDCELETSGGAAASLVLAARGILISTDSQSGMCFFCGASQQAPRPQHIEHGRIGGLSSQSLLVG